MTPHGAEASDTVPKAAVAEGPVAPLPASVTRGQPATIHRIGGARVENLRLKPRETTLSPPGISVIKAPSPAAAAEEIRTGLPRARQLHQQARTIGSATEEAIRAAGFEVIPARSAALPNHHRLIHPQGAAGFNDANLARLAEAFVNTTGH